MNTQQIIQYANELIGAPFLHLGRDPKIGIDCAGLLAYICKRGGLTYFDQKKYSRQPYKNYLVEKIREQPFCFEIRKNEISAGDFIVCKVSRIYPQHIGVFDGEYIIHANGHSGKVEKIRYTKGFRGSVTNVFRFYVN